MRRPILLGTLGLLWALGQGCAALLGGMDPGGEAVRVEEVRLTFSSPAEARLGLELRVDNPERRPAELTLLTWELWVQGRRFATGAEAVGATLPAGGTLPLRFELPLGFFPHPRAGEPSLTSVGVRGKLQARYPGGERLLPFERLQEQVIEDPPAFELEQALD